MISAICDPRVVSKALQHAERAIMRERNSGNIEAIEVDLAACQKVIRRLTAAIAARGDLQPLVTTLQMQERNRTELQARLEAAKAPKPEFNSAEVRAKLERYLVDWKGLLRGHVCQSQQILRRLVKGRLTMTGERRA